MPRGSRLPKLRWPLPVESVVHRPLAQLLELPVLLEGRVLNYLAQLLCPLFLVGMVRSPLAQLLCPPKLEGMWKMVYRTSLLGTLLGLAFATQCFYCSKSVSHFASARTLYRNGLRLL